MKSIENVLSKVKFAACLVGGTLATDTFLKSARKRGAAITYCRAVAIKRVICISSKFMRLHPYICSDLYHIIQQLDALWLLTDLDAVLGHSGPAGATRTRKQREVIVFVSENEKTTRSTVASRTC